MPDAKAVAAFIARWAASSGSEQANSQLFLAEICDVLELKRSAPNTATNEETPNRLSQSPCTPWR